MAELVEPLAWDTEFFGFRIGRVRLDGATPEMLELVETEARDLGIECLYGTLDPADPAAAQLALGFGHRLIDIAITFSRPAVPFLPPPTKTVARRGTADDIPQLDAAIDLMVPWSRFGADPRFTPEQTRRLLAAWVERPLAEPDERMMAVVEDESGLIGVSTQVRSPIPRIDLIGLTKPGSGASQALMAELFKWSGEVPTEAGPIMARNIPTMRYVEHCGFSAARVEYRFHRWLDEGRAVGG